jgi:hypothetical protein
VISSERALIAPVVPTWRIEELDMELIRSDPMEIVCVTRIATPPFFLDSSQNVIVDQIVIVRVRRTDDVVRLREVTRVERAGTRVGFGSRLRRNHAAIPDVQNSPRRDVYDFQRSQNSGHDATTTLLPSTFLPVSYAGRISMGEYLHLFPSPAIAYFR